MPAFSAAIPMLVERMPTSPVRFSTTKQPIARRTTRLDQLAIWTGFCFERSGHKRGESTPKRGINSERFDRSRRDYRPLLAPKLAELFGPVGFGLVGQRPWPRK